MTPITFLLVEDDDVDTASVQRAFKTLKLDNPIIRAKDGLEALECLLGTELTEPLAGPYIVLLDLNMPRMGGLEFLKKLRSEPDIAHTTVMVLTTSDTDDDITDAFAHNVDTYIVKSDLTESLREAIDGLDSFRQLVA